MRTVKMFGPSISDPSKIVDRDVPECDVQAYRAAGYQEVEKDFQTEGVTYTEEQAIAHNDGVDVTAPAKKTRKAKK